MTSSAEFGVKTARRSEFIDITAQVRKAVDGSGVKSGLCCVFVPHTTAGVTVNENADRNVTEDMTKELCEVIPRDGGYAHEEGNSDAHIKSSLVGPSLALIIENGDLKLGTWQCVYFCEFDGPRSRKVWVKITGGDEK